MKEKERCRTLKSEIELSNRSLLVENVFYLLVEIP